MVTSVDDVLEELSPLGRPAKTAAPATKAENAVSATSAAQKGTVPASGKPPAAAQPARAKKAPAPRPAISLEESMVLRALPDEGGTDIDAVARAAGLSAAKTNTLLVQLRLKRRVKFLPGNRVALA